MRTDDPTSTYEIDSYPITGTCVVAGHGLVVFADFAEMTAYDAAGVGGAATDWLGMT